MTYPLINITDHEIGQVMTNLGVAERVERIRQLMYFAQQRMLESQAQEAALERMADNARELGLDY